MVLESQSVTCKCQVLLDITLPYRSINKQLHNFSDNYHPCTPSVPARSKKLTKERIFLYCSAVMVNCTTKIQLLNSFRHQCEGRTAVHNCRNSTPLDKMWNRPVWSPKKSRRCWRQCNRTQWPTVSMAADKSQHNERRSFSVSLKQQILITNPHKSSSSTVAISETRLKFIRKILCIEASL